MAAFRKGTENNHKHFTGIKGHVRSCKWSRQSQGYREDASENHIKPNGEEPRENNKNR